MLWAAARLQSYLSSFLRKQHHGAERMGIWGEGVLVVVDRGRSNGNGGIHPLQAGTLQKDELSWILVTFWASVKTSSQHNTRGEGECIG